MKIKNAWKEKLVASMEIPGDLAYHEAIVTVIGKNQTVIENYRNILRYTKEEIIVQTFYGKIRICGKRLKIPSYSTEEMYITGYITGIFMES